MIRGGHKILVICIYFASFPAAAQFEPLQFANCKKLPADGDRLKCFDAIGPKPRTPEQEAKEPAPVKGKWVYTESQSPVDDSEQVLAVLAGEQEDAFLVFRCIEKRTEAVFVPPSGFFATGRADVLVRIDSASPETISTSVGTNNRALFIYPAADFMKLLPDNGKLFLRASGYQGKQADGTFSLADVSTARNKVAETCHWTTPKVDRAIPAAPTPASVTQPATPPAVAPRPKPKSPAPMKLN
ncbi:type VI secretion system-associated protein TagO [Tardiphaga sp.]|uniref:type VI secretion system-associated protein TagO n=1 Tax=Tardiphaga sp. TaxID=1926292 RepID=UPI00261DC390|nr:type VI secretion system-associated protein TagO [Tardiphaga sp.]MDB5620548.1 hypothetical protein [Tardiphaga sp.]